MMPEAHGVDTDRPAGIVSRGIAAGIDTLVVVVILTAMYFAVVLARLMIDVRDFTFPSTNIVFTMTGFLIVSTLYLASCWAVSGRTAGAVVMGLVVVNRRGARVRVGVARVRAGICVLVPIGLAWAAVDGRRRSIADVLLRTRVVYSA